MNTVLTPRSLKGKRLAMYLRRLLSDPDLAYKLSHLKPKKWKKQYQDNGQDLVPVYFYPNEADWAYLSILSNGTGFSMCYIFVYLMLLDLGMLKLPKKNITKGVIHLIIKNSQIYCSVILNKKGKKLRRILKS